MVTLHEVITFLVSMQISISSLQTHNVNRCGRSRHLARKLSLRRKRSSPNVFEMAATETITSIILIKLIRVSLGTVRHPRRFKIVVDELAQCYNVLPQLDINNTIDHRPEGDEKWFLENEKTVTQFCRKLAAERPLKDIRDEYNYPKKKGIKDECSRLLEASTMKSRRGFAIQRLMNAMRQAHADGWFIVFDTLTLADDRLEAFYDNPNALRD